VNASESESEPKPEPGFSVGSLHGHGLVHGTPTCLDPAMAHCHVQAAGHPGRPDEAT